MSAGLTLLSRELKRLHVPSPARSVSVWDTRQFFFLTVPKILATWLLQSFPRSFSLIGLAAHISRHKVYSCTSCLSYSMLNIRSIRSSRKITTLFLVVFTFHWLCTRVHNHLCSAHVELLFFFFFGRGVAVSGRFALDLLNRPPPPYDHQQTRSASGQYRLATNRAETLPTGLLSGAGQKSGGKVYQTTRRATKAE